jgi:hypothetical protein
VAPPRLATQRLQEAVDAVDRLGSQVAAARFLDISRAGLQTPLRRAASAGITPRTPDVAPIKEAPPPKPRVRVQAGRPEGTTYKVLAIGDAHDSPELGKKRFHWMGRHAAEMGADWVVQIGDMLTLDSLNSHIPNDTLQAKTKNPFYHDLESGAVALGEFDRGLGSHRVRKHCTLGNHERRAWFYEDAKPETAGLITGPLLALFEQHQWGTSEYGAFFFLGMVGFNHAPLNKLKKTMGGDTRMNVLNKMVFDYVRGHDHQDYVQSAAKFGPLGGVTLVGLGCALPWGHEEKYAQHALNGWWWGVKELQITGGRLESVSSVSMLELERRYG